MKHTTDNYVRIGLMLVCMFGICIAAFFIYRDNEQYTKQFTANERTIQELQDSIDETVVYEGSVDDSKAAVNTARTLGNRIADLQNQYTDLMRQKLEKKIEEAVCYSKLDNISLELDTYFGEDSTFRSGWFFGDVLNYDWTWDFCTNYNFSGNDVSVLWQCSNEGQLVAYVTGTYHADTHKIDGLRKYVTLAGTSIYGATQSDESINRKDSGFDSETYGNEILDMAKNIKADGEILVPERTQQEQEAYENAISDIKRAQYEAREQYSNSHK